MDPTATGSNAEESTAVPPGSTAVEKKEAKETSTETYVYPPPHQHDTESLLERAGESAAEMVDHMKEEFRHLSQTLKETLHVVHKDASTPVGKGDTGGETAVEAQGETCPAEEEILLPAIGTPTTNEPDRNEASENEPLTPEKSETKGSEKSSPSVFSQMAKRIGDFFSINDGKKKKESTKKESAADANVNVFLPADDEVVIDTTNLEDRVSI